MPYSFNPHRHVKIWLSTDPSKFTTLKNKIRLLAFRETNPNDSLTIVFDSSLLNNQARNELTMFARENRLDLYDVSEHLFDAKTNTVKARGLTERELRLLQIYKYEYDSLRNAGNVVVLSDILRWLKPIYFQGTYTDFDVPVNTHALPATIAVERPLLLNIGSIVQINGEEMIALNNDVVAVVDAEAARENIEAIQDGILNAHEPHKQQSSGLGLFVSDSIRQSLGILRRTPYNGLVRAQNGISRLHTPPNALTLEETEAIKVLETWYFEKLTPLQIRWKINAILQVPIADYMRAIYNIGNPLKEMNDAEVRQWFIEKYRAICTSQTSWFSITAWNSTTKLQLREAQLLSQLPDDVFIERIRLNTCSDLLRECVSHTSGPSRVLQSLFSKPCLPANVFAATVEPHSLWHYGLAVNFMSHNSWKLHATASEAYNQLPQLGVTCDLSWMPVGIAAITEHEAASLQRNLPAEMQQLKIRVSQKIDDVAAQNNGLLSFWGKEQRMGQIALLRRIENNMREDNCAKVLSKIIAEGFRSEEFAARKGMWADATFVSLLEDIISVCRLARVLQVDLTAPVAHQPQCSQSS